MGAHRAGYIRRVPEGGAPVKIAVIHNLPSGGGRRALIAHARGLAGRGHAVEVFELATGVDPLEDFSSLGLPVHRFAMPVPPDREIGLLGRPSPGTVLRALRLLAALPRTWRRVAVAVDSGGFDVALVGNDQFTHSPHVLRYLATPAVLYGGEPLRYVYDAPLGRLTGQGSPLFRVVRAAADVLLKCLLRGIDARNIRATHTILTNSHFTHESFLRCYARPARVVYLGVDAERFRPLGLRRERMVLSVGAMHPAKGYDFLIDALARIPPAARPELLLVSDRGYGSFQQRLETYARERAVAFTVRYRIPEDELVALYNRAGALAYAPYLEPFGLVVLEAMACGAPVVAVAEGGVRETVQHGVTGLLAPRDPGRFADCLRAVLDDRQLADRLGEAGRSAVVERWTWESSTEALESALCERVAAA